MLKNWLDKGKCALGFHEGEWRYAAPNSCLQTRVCARCQAESRQTTHILGNWNYRAQDSCELLRACARCDHQESKSEHTWARPIYPVETSCQQVIPCARCGETKPGKTVHIWEHWQHEKEDACTQIESCARCGVTGRQRRVSHQWSNWQASAFYESNVRVCGRCAEMVFDLPACAEGPSLQAVDRAVAALVSATDVYALRQQMHVHRDILFTPVTDRFFQFARERYSNDQSRITSLNQFQTLIAQCATDGIDAAFQAAVSQADVSTASPAQARPVASGARSDSASAVSIDSQLIGHWRHTESMGSGGFTQATDTHLILDENGRFAWYSKSAGSAGQYTSDREYGQWTANAGRLEVKFDDGKTLSSTYATDHTRMLLHQQGRYRLWHRV